MIPPPPLNPLYVQLWYPKVVSQGVMEAVIGAVTGSADKSEVQVMAKQASEVSRVHDLYYCISRDEDNGFTLSIKNGNCLDSAIFLYTAIF